MKKLNGRELKALFILSIVVPISLLTTLRLTGILKEPITISETTTLEAVKWEFERPACHANFWDYVEGSYVNDISINQYIFIDDYWPDASEYGGSSTLQMNLSLTATLAEGHIENVIITFNDDYLNSFVRIFDLEFGGKKHTLAVWENLTATSYEDLLYGIGRTEKTFVNFRGVYHPRRVHLRISPTWVLRSLLNQTQQLVVSLEVVYFNGKAYRKVVQPFELKLVSDDNNSFEKAEEISFEQSDKKHVLGGKEDTQDFYKIYLQKDNVIHITMTPPIGQDFDLYLYSSTDRSNPVASATHREDATESIDYKADSTGWWFIKVQQVGGWGIYTLSLTLLPTGES